MTDKAVSVELFAYQTNTIALISIHKFNENSKNGQYTKPNLEIVCHRYRSCLVDIISNRLQVWRLVQFAMELTCENYANFFFFIP